MTTKTKRVMIPRSVDIIVTTTRVIIITITINVTVIAIIVTITIASITSITTIAIITITIYQVDCCARPAKVFTGNPLV